MDFSKNHQNPKIGDDEYIKTVHLTSEKASELHNFFNDDQDDLEEKSAQDLEEEYAK